jgi:hypothetical protein
MNFSHDTSGMSDRTIHEMIRVTAYSKYLARGCTPNSALADWLEAEEEIRHHFGLNSLCSTESIYEIRIDFQ